MFQQMMGQIREETVGFLFNLEVEVSPGAAGAVDAPVVAAKGLTPPPETAGGKLSYTAPSDSGGVEVRNQRGQIQQAATDRARKAAVTATAPEEAAAETSGPPQRGAFGQRAESDAPAPVNRAERRTQGKKK